jgi:methylated-DNA-[protein]-cysteine S-methyltransferase
MTFFHTIDSPIGELLLLGDGHALTGLRMEPFEIAPGARQDPGAFAGAEAQLRAYFDGELREFDLPLAPHGTEFQLRVWAALRAIPYGETATYGEIAAEVGRPDAPRAVGAANGRNPIAVIVPCHRVIGSDGTLTGFGGGLERKRILLELEAGVLPLV